MKKRLQKRGTCPYCLRSIAVNEHGLLADHGYRTVQSYKFTGSCVGSDLHHLGHVDAKEEMSQQIKNLGQVSLKALKEKDQKTAKTCTAEISRLQELINNWKEAAPVELDLDVVEKEEKARITKEREAKEAAKEKALAEKEKRKLEREEKSRIKWIGILASNTHIIEKEGKVLVEWITEYETRKDLEDDHYKRTREYMESIGLNDWNDRYDFSWNIVHRVKAIAGKQLHKF